MLEKGDLVWIPQRSVLLIETPNNPGAIRITQEPEVGLFIGHYDVDNDFYIILSDGKEWLTNKRHVKKMRKTNASKVS